jgi:coproporphyrinogen III oxidase-like Fe-S oxidoreductase
MPELNELKPGSPPLPVAGPVAHPFDRMIPVTMSHYPITYSGVINDPDTPTLDHYVSRLGANGLPSSGPAMLYLHIPFCDQICTFCRYARQRTPERSVFEKYAAALKTEMQLYLELPYVRETSFDLIYFGGGTPSVMPIEIMADLIGWINGRFKRGKKEISFEGEARTLRDMEYLTMLKENGVSRVSMGVQSFDPKLRKILGRMEGLDDIYETIDNARKLALDVNFDLLYWLPYQTIDHIKSDIDMVRKLRPTDVDWYNMVYDPLLKNDPLSRLVTRKKDVLEDTEGLLQTRIAMRDGFRDIGFHQHFVDNYASSARKDSYHVLRTGNYDGSAQTLGVGVSSLGTLSNIVYSNPGSLEAYYQTLETRPYPFKWVFDLTPARQIERVLFHFVRNMLLPKSVFARSDLRISEPYRERVEQLVGKGLVEETDQNYALTEEGKLWYGNVASYLLGNVGHEKMLKRLYMRILH